MNAIMTSITAALAVCFVLMPLTAFAAASASRQQEKQPSSSSIKNDDDDEQQQQHFECGVYLAPSTIPNAGLGMFAGRRIETREQVAPGDVIVPVHDYALHNPSLANGDHFFASYGWSVHLLQGLLEEGPNTLAWISGTGAALNCDLPLVNLIGCEDKILFSDSNINARYYNNNNNISNPGGGAFTPFHNRYNVAVRNIQPGEELFDSYGDGYFAAREDIYGKIPLTDDYDRADILLHKYVHIRDSISLMNMNERQQDSRNTDTTAGVATDTYNLISNLKDVWQSRVLNALPKDASDIDPLVKEGGTSFMNYNRSLRTIQWLDKHGSCMDHIESRLSQIPQAGRGAFARRFISKGQVIGPAPVLHFNRTTFAMHEPIYDRNGEYTINASSPIIHQQLVLNYCYGHRQSSLLLCPYGMNINAINHSKNKANAKLVWDNNELMAHPEWLQQPPQQWIDTQHAGLVLSVEATRDIHPNEEILLNYGTEWQEAWDHHIAKWKPPKDAGTYIPARELNKQEVLLTLSEGHYDDNNVDVSCREIYRVWSGLKPSDKYVEHVYWGSESNAQRSSYYCRPIYRYKNNNNNKANDNGDSNGGDIYTAELYKREYNTQGGMCTESVVEVLFAVPRDAFLFVDKPYTRDHAQPWSFRHDIRIPDEIFPDIWKDI